MNMDLKKMKKFFTFDRHASDGFTLVELIVVIAVLAILVGVAVPTYSGYVKKAETAADEALLAEVNMAFAAACAINSESHVNRKDVATVISLVDGQMPNAFVGNADIQDSFSNTFYEGGKFKQYQKIAYNKTAGVFSKAVVAGSYAGSQEDVSALQNSALGQMGAGVILDMVGGTMDGLGVDIAQDALPKALASAAYKVEAAKALGLVGANADEATAVAAYDAYISAKEEAAKQQYFKDNPSMNPANPIHNGKATEAAQAQIDALEKNLLAVVGAAKSEEAANGLIELLQSGDAYNALKGNVKGENGGDNVTLGISQSALAYALYVSYAGENADPSGFITALQGTNTGFNEYLTSTEQVNVDLAGAIGAMNIISSQDSATIEQTVLNGLDNEELAAALQQILGQ